MAKDVSRESMGEMNLSERSRRKSKLTSCGHAAALGSDNPERKQVELELIAAKEYAESIVETVPEPLVVLTPELIVKSANAAFYKYFKVSPEETLGRRIYDLGNGQWNIPALRELLEDVLPANSVCNDYEVSHDFETIGPRVMLLNARRLDHMRLILLGIRDITDRKQAEEAVRLSEEKFSTVFDMAPFAMSLAIPPDGVQYEVNQAWLDMTGFARKEEVLGKTSLELGLIVEPESRERILNDFREHGSVRNAEIVARTKAGARRTLRVNLDAVEIGGRCYILSAHEDITERRQAEEALRESKNLMQADLDAMRRLQELGMLLVREEHLGPILTEIVDAAIAISGADFGNIQFLDPTSGDLTIVAQRGFPQWWLDFWNSVSKGQGSCGTALDRRERVIVEDVESSPIFAGTPALEVQRQANVRAVQSTPLVSRSGRPLGMFSTHYRTPHRPDDRTLRLLDLLSRQAADIIESAQAEQALRESEERLRFALETSHTGAWDLDLVDHSAFRSLEHDRIFGYAELLPEWTYEMFLKHVLPEDRAAVDAKFRRAIAAGSDWSFECRIRRVDGEVRWIWAAGRHRTDAAGLPRRMVGIVQDITERKQWEIALREANQALVQRTRQLQKLMLELSQAEERERQRLAEILHDDLQQQLAATKFHLGLLGKQIQEDDCLRDAVDYAVGLLKDAIDKSRRLSRELSPVLLYHGDFGEVLEWLARQMQAKHGLVVHMQARGAVEVSSDAIKALLFRAAQEILFNTVKHAQVAEATIRLRRRRGWLWMGIGDRGRGFDPKALKANAGFGLASIRERVELLGGRMKIRSAPGRGSTFLIAVPDTTAEGEPVRTKDGRRRGACDLSGSRLRVLLADDHEIVRQGLVSLLSEEHTVEVVGEAANGREAVDLAGRLEPDVVIIDVSMPLITGDEATRQIKTHRPRTRVIALSIYDEPEKMETMYRAGAESYVLKTAPSEELLAAIRGPASEA